MDLTLTCRYYPESDTTKAHYKATLLTVDGAETLDPKPFGIGHGDEFGEQHAAQEAWNNYVKAYKLVELFISAGFVPGEKDWEKTPESLKDYKQKYTFEGRSDYPPAVLKRIADTAAREAAIKAADDAAVKALQDWEAQAHQELAEFTAENGSSKGWWTHGFRHEPSKWCVEVHGTPSRYSHYDRRYTQAITSKKFYRSTTTGKTNWKAALAHLRLVADYNKRNDEAEMAKASAKAENTGMVNEFKKTYDTTGLYVSDSDGSLSFHINLKDAEEVLKLLEALNRRLPAVQQVA